MFEPPPLQFTNPRTGAVYWLTYKLPSGVKGAAVDRIIDCCNEDRIYRWLFETRLSGRPYSQADAADWLSWLRDGWTQQSHFAFLILEDESQLPVGSCDIKSSNRLDAEIGYWSSARTPGVATPAVRLMIRLARDAGFASFHAMVHPQNDRSLRLLERLGFRHAVERRTDDRSCLVLPPPIRELPTDNLGVAPE